MAYKSFKELLGETSLERKCRFLFGLCLLVLIRGYFLLLPGICFVLALVNLGIGASLGALPTRWVDRFTLLAVGLCLMLLAFLIGLAAGGVSFSRLLRKRPGLDPAMLLSILLAAAGLLEVAERLLIDGEEAHGRAVFRGHVRDGRGGPLFGLDLQAEYRLGPYSALHLARRMALFLPRAGPRRMGRDLSLR